MADIKYGADLELAIALGHNRRETKWKNTTKTWAELVKRLSSTQRTHETMAEYVHMAKGDQDNIKDVGGFVAGELKDGRRKNGYVLSRSLITLDADFAPVDLWDDIETFTTYAILAYSTHKHTATKPRLRLLIPLARKVTPEEYEAIARKLAAEIGIDYFDDTTYEPARLMYWPSTPKDGNYFFKYVDAPILNPDSILKTYTDWRDASFWPESSRCTQTRKKAADKQGDPLTKTGLIGAFCRAYTIPEAIAKFIPEAYIECDTAGRYTYAHGSTAAGLVIYEDKFAYSNHGTDPISGQLCNAFDLVRIHKFGELDKDAKDDVVVNKLPSWTAMMDLASNDEETRYQIGVDKLEAAADDFGEELKAPENKEWLKKLTTTKGGEFEATIANLKTIIQNDPNLLGIGGRDLFRDRYTVTHKLPWTRSGSCWTDLDDAGLRDYIEQVYGIESRNKILDALTLVFEENSYNPVKDYIEAATWDGTPRVESLLIDYLGAADTTYTRTVTRKALTAAVARIYEPGYKFDYMLTLVGHQGIGKSLIIKKLAGEWASDTLTDIRGKESYEALDGVWIMEMSELTALKRGDREAIKSYISKTEDTYRKAYARNTTISKRQCIFIGTTNDHEFLDDPTGNRRFWVVDTDFDKRTKTVWVDLTPDEVHQIWAEALQILNDGENAMQLNADVKDEATAVQKAHSSVDTLKGVIEDLLATPIPKDWAKKSIFERQQFYSATNDYKAAGDTSQEGELRKRICAIEVWVEGLGKDPATLTTLTAKRINDCIEQLGWLRQPNPVEFKGYGRQRGFYRP